MLFVRAQKLFRKKKSKKFPPTLKWVGTSFFLKETEIYLPKICCCRKRMEFRPESGKSVFIVIVSISQSFTKQLQYLFSIFPPLTNKDCRYFLFFIRNKFICIGIVKEFHIRHGVCFSVECNVFFGAIQDI